jgi:hypothetical protein
MLVTRFLYGKDWYKKNLNNTEEPAQAAAPAGSDAQTA